jgi:hypothetical protein
MTGSRKFDQSDKRPHKSLYKIGYVSSADYICELIFKIRADVFKSVYPESFWNTGKYKGQYVGQKIQASKLLKEYSPAAIIEAVKKIRPIKLNDDRFLSSLKRFEKKQKPREIQTFDNTPKAEQKPLKKRSKLEGL